MAQLSLFAAGQKAKSARKRARKADSNARGAARKAAQAKRAAERAAKRHEAVKVRAYSRRWPSKKK